MLDLSSINETISKAKLRQSQIRKSLDELMARKQVLIKRRDKIKELIKHFEITKKYIVSFDEVLPDAGDG